MGEMGGDGGRCGEDQRAFAVNTPPSGRESAALCTEHAEQRVNTRDTTAVHAGEYGRLQLHPCPLERALEYRMSVLPRLGVVRV